MADIKDNLKTLKDIEKTLPALLKAYTDISTFFDKKKSLIKKIRLNSSDIMSGTAAFDKEYKKYTDSIESHMSKVNLSIKDLSSSLSNTANISDRTMKESNAKIRQILDNFKDTGNYFVKDFTEILDLVNDDILKNKILKKLISINQDIAIKKMKIVEQSKGIAKNLNAKDLDNVFLSLFSIGDMKSLNPADLSKFKSRLMGLADNSKDYFKFIGQINKDLMSSLGSDILGSGKKISKFGKFGITDIIEDIFSNQLNESALAKKYNPKIAKQISNILGSSIENLTPGDVQMVSGDVMKTLLKAVFPSMGNKQMEDMIKFAYNKTSIPLLNSDVSKIEGKFPNEVKKTSSSLSELFVRGVEFEFMRSKFPGLTHFIVGIKTVFDVLRSSLTNIVSGDLGTSILGFAGLIGVAAGIAVQGMSYLMRGVEKLQKMYIDAAGGSGLNLQSFANRSRMRRTPTINERFAMGGGEEKLIEAQASTLARMGGNQMFNPTTSQQRDTAFFANFTDQSTGTIAALQDVMENIQRLGFSATMLGMFNQSGILFNKVIKDMSENLNEFILYGQNSFSNLSLLANKLGVSTKNAIGLIEKFSTVSSSIQTSYKLGLVTGNYQNPLQNFMEYAFGDPDKIFERVIGSFGGEVKNMNRIQQKYLSEITGMTIEEINVASQRIKIVKQIGEDAYKKQYSTLDELVNSFGFKRLLGGISELLGVISDRVMNKFFEKTLKYLEDNADKIPKIIDDFVIKFSTIVPIIFSALLALSESLLFLAQHATTIFGTVIGAYMGSFLGPLGTAAGGVIGGLAGSLLGKPFSGEQYDYLQNTLKNTKTVFNNNIKDGYVSRGNVVQTDPNDMAIFAKTNDGLLNTAMSAIRSNGGNISINTGGSSNSKGGVNVISVKSDIKMDSHKVGKALTEVAFAYN